MVFGILDPSGLASWFAPLESCLSDLCVAVISTRVYVHGIV